MGLLEPDVGYRSCHGQTALIDDEDPSPRAQRMAIWAVIIICVVTAAYLALVPGAWDGMVTSMKFLTGYNEIEHLYE